MSGSSSTFLHRTLLRALSILVVLTTVAMTSLFVIPEAARAAGGSLLSGETFENSSVSDAKWIGLGDACLTAAKQNGASPGAGSNLPGCKKVNKSPAVGSGSNGFLQLTDESGASTGAAVYNRAFPSSAGLEVSFYEYQYGGSGADGIGVFLTDGAYSLTKPGPQGGNVGGALGYGSIEGMPGVAHGYLGVGLDVWGNFSKQPYVGIGCSPSTEQTSNSVVLRGSGDGTQGYCIVNSTKYAGLRNAPSQAPGGATGTPQLVKVSVSPTTEADPYPTVTITINGKVISTSKMKTPAPPTMKVGFTASTGGATDVHLIRQVEVRTVNSLGSINLVKGIDRSTSTGTTKQIFTDGDSVPFSFLVTNSGTETLNSVAVNDPKISKISCPKTGLAPTEAMTCTGTYGPLTADDVKSGTFTNTAAATGVTTSGENARSESTAKTPTYQSAKLAVTKKITGGAAASVPSGTKFSVDYTYPSGSYVPAPTAEGVSKTYETGSGTLTVAADGTATSDKPIPAGAKVTLSEQTRPSIPGAAWGSPTWSQNPVTMGSTGTTTSTLTNPIAIVPKPSLSLQKSASPSTITRAGDAVTYSFAVKNTGNVPLSKVGIVEGDFSGSGKLSAVSCPDTTLAVGASTTCTATYTATAADIDAGTITNSATATGTPDGLGPVASGPSKATVTAERNPALTIVKHADPTVIKAAGDKVSYSFDVKNTGNTSLSKVGVTDTDFSGTGNLSNITCKSTSLGAGASTTCTATYTATQADVDAGTITNTASAHGTPAGADQPVDSPTSTATIDAPRAAAITVEKTADPSVITRAGEKITYSFAVTNKGNTTLTKVGVDEGAFTGTGDLSAIDCPDTSLAPGKSTTCTATYTVTQADVDAGKIENSATAHGTSPGADAPVTSPEARATVTGKGVPAVSVVKTATPSTISAAGETIDYTFEVTNSGDTTLSKVGVTDDEFSGTGDLSAISCPDTALAPGESTTCTASYTATQADVDAGKISNTAVAHGTPPGNGDPVGSEPSQAEVTALASASISVAKSAEPSTVRAAGETIEYSFRVENTGNTTLSKVSVTDDDFSGTGDLSEILCPQGSLAPGTSTTCTATYRVTQADVDAGTVTNSASAHGTPPGGTDPIDSPTSEATVKALAAPEVSLQKSASPSTITTAGQKIDYSFEVTNEGNTTLTKIGIDESEFSGSGDLSAIDCPEGALAPGASATCTASYTATQADVDAGRISNTAAAHGTAPGSEDPVTSPEDSASVTANQAPALSVEKSSDPTVVAKAGQKITYSFAVTNTGNTTLRDVAVDEGDFTGTGELSTIDCPETTLAPGKSTTCTADYTVTQDDVDAGTIDNTASAHGTPPGTDDPVTSPPDSTTVAGRGESALSITKTASPQVIDEAGRDITYSFEVTNTGDTTLSKVSVTDDEFSGSGELSAIDCPTTSLAPGASTTCTATYTATQADVDAGRITNTATAHGTPPRAEEPIDSQPASAEVLAPAAPGIQLRKSADPTTVTASGQSVDYSFAVTNTGNTTLSKISVSDDDFSGSGELSAVTCPATSLAPDATTTCTATYTVTQDDVDAGAIDNSASAHGTPPGSSDPIDSEPSEAHVSATRTPALSVEKSTDPTVITTAGQKIDYSFEVTNEGNTTLTKIGIDEGDFTGSGDLSAIDCPETSLAPGASTTCTATYTATQADVDAGQIDNTATAHGTAPGADDPVSSPPDSATVVGEGQSALEVHKSASPTTVDHSGAQIQYTFHVTNTGDTTLSDVGVSDESFSGTGDLSDVSCPTTSLAPGASVDCTASYTATQADVDAGRIVNSATAHGTPPRADEPIDSSPSTSQVIAPAAPALELSKTADPTTVTAAGQEIDYSFEVTNTGNTTLSRISVSDDDFSGSGELSAIDCPEGGLAPGASRTCTATYTVTQADIDAGTIDNTASAHGNAPGADTPVNSDPSTAQVTAERAPALSVEKSADPSVVSKAGQKVEYSFEVTNTGNTTVSEVGIDEGEFSGTGDLSDIDCPETELAPGKSTTCTATYTVTQDDVDAGSVSNTATAHGTPPGTDQPVTSPPDSTTVVGEGQSALEVHKSASPSVVHTAGETVDFTFAVTNTGDTTLSAIDVSDDEFSGSGRLSEISCPTTTLAPGASVDCTANYTTTQADVDAGSITNTATAHGTPPRADDPIDSEPSSAVVQVPAAPGLEVVKSADPGTVTTAGQAIDYSFEVTNTGNTTLSAVGITEGDFSGSGELSAIDCPETGLAPGASTTCTASYEVTQADVDAGRITNAARAHGTPPGAQTPVTSPEDSAVVTATQAPALTVTKSADPTVVTKAGDAVEYSFDVTNTGNTTLHDVAISEAGFTGTGDLSAIDCPETSLAPGASTSCTATYTVTQDDVDAGTIANTASAHGTPPGTDQPVTSPPSSTTIAGAGQSALTLSKSAAPTQVQRAGETVAYTFTVTNTGDTTLTGISVSDTDFSGTGGLSEIDCPARSLAPGAAVDCTANYTVTQADVDAGLINNTATAHGTPPRQEEPIDSLPSSAQVQIPAAADLTLQKSADVSSVSEAGQEVTYSFEVTNTGNTTLSQVGIDEGEFSGSGDLSEADCPDGGLAPGASTTCTATYTVTQADMDEGQITNTATSHGTPPSGRPLDSAPSDARITAAQAPALSVEKSADPTVVSKGGQEVEYSFEVTNTGNTTLAEVGIDEGEFSGTGDLSEIDCPEDDLAPGESTTCTATYTVTQDDVDAGSISNTATAHGTPPGVEQPVSSPPSTATVGGEGSSALTLSKSADRTVVTSAGQQIRYAFEIRNTGDTTLTDVQVDEGDFSGSGELSAADCPSTTLAPGESVTCAADYTVTQADMDAGRIDNTATAQGAPKGGGDPVTSSPSSAVVEAPAAAGISVTKSADAKSVDHVGQKITYSFAVTNTGTMTLHGVTVEDQDFDGTGEVSPVHCPTTALAPGDSMTCTATYRVTQEDVKRGALSNTAVVQATPPDGGGDAPGTGGDGSSGDGATGSGGDSDSDGPVTSSPSTVVVPPAGPSAGTGGYLLDQAGRVPAWALAAGGVGIVLLIAGIVVGRRARE